MYVGHLALGVALKARYPKVPTLAILLGTGLLDLLNGIFVVLGIDTVTPNPAATPLLFFDLTFVDWDHSLLMALNIAALWALLFRRDKTAAWVAGAAVFSHWLVDWPMHNLDLALYPHSDLHFGMNLWGKWGIWSWVAEGVFTLVLAAYAWNAYAVRGKRLLWPCVVLLVLFLQSSPWLSPLRFVATLEEPAAHLAAGVLIFISFLLPGLLLAWLLDRTDRIG
ncbi:MAG TPA: hypothetical protein VM553_02220 [Dongiaceae bacterium]|nr:hypothetical protein [Dongiaceae bacterium]